ncbi:MAG: large conductance mechanosensitive channel protein MscL [Chitinophagaceae bacterium]|nr:large conductance mechanosensitive channel protein MscL [Chitinophagaceae bacterium]
MIKEFKEFAMKGNLVDIAVAFVMGAAFGKVVTSFTTDIISPLIGLLGGKDLSKNAWVIKEGAKEVKDAAGKIVIAAVPEVSVKWGAFLTATLDFILVAFVMFLIIKGINALKKKQEKPTVLVIEHSSTDKLLMEIRDAVRK